MKKSFERGQAVEVRRDPSCKWEPATYEAPQNDWRGYHKVLLAVGAERYIDSMSGDETTAENPRAYKTRTCIVPSRRIRECPA